ncbi:MAG TPA: hypothetical protein VKU41_03040 [Polyangiaceae bacterium]|nr:hypothetical protein [Polyangiaceae bacterium]
MRIVFFVAPLALSVAACGSGEPGKHSVTSPAPGKSAGAFTPPPLPAGYTRLNAATITDILPGTDVTHCQYVMAPLDHDVDIVDVEGRQSAFGHHAVAFSYTPSGTDKVGSEVKCMMDSTEFTSGVSSAAGGGNSAQSITGGAFLGGVGPKGRTTTLPDGVAFRLKKGEGIVLNLHYINPGATTVSGDAYMDLKFADVDPTRLIAALFVNINGGFQLTPSMETNSSVDCVAKSDVNIIMMANHMHEYGTHATTSVVHADTGAVEVLRDDPVWTTDMVNNPTYATWSAASPFVLHAGDVIRTSCSWINTTDAAITFPREMCISAGFALATGDNPTAPLCYNGSWIQQ